MIKAPHTTHTRDNRTSKRLLSKSRGDEAHLQLLQDLHTAHEGKPFVFNDDHLRLLYLSPECMQSAMRLDAPERLICGYSQVMMGFLLLNPTPRHIILVGLGGGSLVKYCYRYLPDCRITAIEINADVIVLRDQFLIPANDERFCVIHADALSCLTSMQSESDVILIDAYDQHGLVPALNTAEFYQDCYRNLRSGGILVSNVGGKPSVLAPMLSRLRQQFARQVCWIKSPDSYNLIVFAIKEFPHAIEKLKTSLMKQTEYPELTLTQLPSLMHHIDLINDDGEIPALLNDLRHLLVEDPKVPQSYAAWKTYVLA
ncbi:fused MFS/spermidine synthase [Undibacterium sp. SXout7W]|uniref:fused MFS/spermidine synthase n=1 Tax=Undibacterium sp. SXout7W TaxID=3413049 RepID=UPI003BF35E2B